jgi:hypothetical protein
MRWVRVLLLVAASGCNKDSAPTYTQFNEDDENLTIDVGAAKKEPAKSIELYSSTGEVTVGIATVDPGGGPIGTEHVIVVEVENAYENIVDRVSVRTNSAERGEDEYDMDPDSADEGFYKLTLVSVGKPGEVRTDTFTIRLWDEDDDEDSAGKDTGSKKKPVSPDDSG